MICSLSPEKERIALEIVNRVVAANYTISPETILKNVYNVIFEEYLKVNKQKDASTYAFAMTQYVAGKLHLLVKADAARKMFGELTGSQKQFEKENIEVFQKREELEKLLGIKALTIDFVPTSVEKSNVQEHLNKITTAFPQVISTVMYGTSAGTPMTWNFSVLKNEDGTDMKLIRVTEFLKGSFAKSKDTSGTLSTRRGDLADIVVRKFFANPMPYEKFRENMLQDKEYTDLFRRFSENAVITNTLPSPVVTRYMDDLIKDMLYAINFIQTNYQDAYLTDLRSLVETSNLTPQQKSNFFLYSKELGIRGELDLLAVYPDGSFRVIDIKTTDGNLSQKRRVNYGRQASIYDMMIAQATGLKSKGENDIVYLTTTISNVSTILGTKDKGPFKIGVTAFAKETNKNQNPDMLSKEISIYREKIDSLYNRVAPTPVTHVSMNPMNPMISSWFNKKGPDGLKMILDSNDELASYEDLVSYKEWLEERFPELAGKVNIIRTANSQSGARFFLDTIDFYEKVNKGAGFHEGWHRFSQLYMTRDEKLKLYKSVKNQNISFSTRDGRDLNTATADNLDIEELLAEEFRKYATNPKGYSPMKGNKTAKGWFAKIWEALKSIYKWLTNNGTVSYVDLFEQLNTNTFNRSNYSANNAIFKQLNSLFIDSTSGNSNVIDNMTFRQFRDFVDFKLTEYLTNKNIVIGDLLTLEGSKKLTELVKSSLQERRDIIASGVTEMEDAINQSDDEVTINSLKTNIENFKYYANLLDYILEQNNNNDYVRVGDFMRAYFRFSQYKSLSNLFSKNQNRLNKLIDEESLSEYLKKEEEGEDEETGDGDAKPADDAPDIDYNNPGNLKQAIEFARDELKDFFNGIPRLASSDLSETEYEMSDGGMPATLSREEAFYKTLNILQGSPTLSMMMLRLNSTQSLMLFPELRTIKDRLMGDPEKGVEGLIPKLQRLSGILCTTAHTAEDIEEHGRLMSFLMHFGHVMSLRKVTFDTNIRRMNFAPDNENSYVMSPVQTRENLESIINSILNDFTKGFQLQTEKRFKESNKEYVSIYDAMYQLFGEGEKGLTRFMMDFQSENPFIYDHHDKRFYFNAFYVYSNFRSSNPETADLKEFFSHLGITLNDKAYENPNHLSEIKSVYNRIRNILFTYHKNTGENIARLFNTEVVEMVKEWKRIKDMATSEDVDGAQKFMIMNALRNKELEIQKYAYRIFSSGPVSKMLFDGKDKNLIKDPKYKVFAAYLPLFQQLARVEKNYHKRFSSGSMIVIDKLQFSHFLPNNMLVTEMHINEHINSFSDFANYPEMSHLDPIKNPQVLNSWMFSKIFAKDGSKVPNMRFGISVISQISDITDEDVESKRIQDLSAEEKILADAIMLATEGSTEMRRMETSNTAWRLSLQRMSGIDRKFLKPVNIVRDGFSNPAFLNQMRNYIQHAAWKYQYYRTQENRDRDVNHANKAMDHLGVFDEMLPLSKEKIKTFIREQGGDMNTLMVRMETLDNELFKEMTEEIIKYFEGITLTNDNSYKNMFNNMLSEKSKAKLATLASINSDNNPFYMQVNTLNQLSDNMFRDIIANDFIMAMEDSLLLFGDYTYYKDPIKRRKIIANNGSIHMVDDIMAEAMFAQTSARSLKRIIQTSRGVTTDKDFQLVKKLVIADVKMRSSMLENDQMLKALLLLYQQKFPSKSGITLEEMRVRKANILDGFANMEVADGGAYLNLDTNRFMRMREMVWDWDKDEKEYVRQIIILKKKLENNLSEEEEDFINKGQNKDRSYSSFNVSKYALTGPVHYTENSPLTPSFDKMGLRVLLPEFDWDRITRPLLEKMYLEDIDYMVMDSASKGYTPPVEKAFSPDGLKNIVGKTVHSTYHAGGFFKFQQNTTHTNDSSTFAVQLRSIFYEGLLTQEKFGIVSTSLKNAFAKVVRSLSDYIRINSSRGLTEMGLDIEGKMRDRATFVNHIRERLLQIGDVDEKLLEHLKTDNSGEFGTFLEALPFQKNVVDLIAGIIDDNFRKVKMNGSKLYQSFEMGTSKMEKVKDADLPAEFRGTMELKWHGLKVDDKGNVISTTPVECRLPFRKQFYPLLNLKHTDGEYINTMKRLNEMIKDEKWLSNNADAITFIGVRIPLQDLSFTSHMIVREFLPESFGDMIILPPEFYQQSGGDNDIDTVTASFRYLNTLGRIIKRPTESYTDIISRIEELSTKISNDNKFVVVKTDAEVNKDLENIKKEFLENEVYASKNKTAADLDRDLTIVEQDGYRTVAGFINNKSTLFKLRTKNREEFVDIMNNVEAFVNSLNKKKKIDSPELKELNEMNTKKENYIKGITNDIVGGIMEFLEAPENFDFLTETDSLSKVQEIAEANMSRKSGQDVKLGKTLTSLESMGMVANVMNHHNNFAQRSILGSLIRVRSMLPILEMAGLVIQKEYRAGALPALLTRVNTGIPIFDNLTDKDKTYMRLIDTPLLYKKDTSKGIKVSVYNEDGERATKELSAEVTTLLDLFKNADIFPSLGITWLNVKTKLFLIAQGVPLSRAILFLNTPVVQDVQKHLDTLGTDARPKHALVSSVQQYAEEIFPISEASGEYPEKGKVRVKKEVNGNLIIDKFMPAPGKRSQEYLGGKNISFSEEDMDKFTRDYGEYTRTVSPKKQNLRSFLFDNPSYTELAKDIAAYYGTLLADGDMFYLMFVKGLSRNSTKINSKSAIAYNNALTEARIASGMANPEFENKISEQSMLSAFYNDDIINNILANAFPNILTNNNKFFVKQYEDMLQRVVWDTYGTPEDRRKVEMRVMSDFIYSTYLNFFVFKDGQNANTLYEYFQYDISPLLRPLVESGANHEAFAKGFDTRLNAMSEDQKIASLYSNSLLSRQLETLSYKYEELMKIPFINSILIKAEHGIDPQKDGIPQYKDILNALSQNYIVANLSPNPKDREAEETIFRSYFEKLINFDISQFPALQAKVSQNQERLDFYQDPANKKEISKLFNVLAYYLMAQGSPLERSKGSFSYLIPTEISKNVIETSINNFNRFLEEGASSGGGKTTLAETNAVIDKYIKDFEKMFKDMNPDLKWNNASIPRAQATSSSVEEGNELWGVHASDLPSKKEKERPGLPYQKSHTGKLYSKLLNVDVAHFANRLAKEQDVKLGGKNDFRLSESEDEIDPLNCSI